MKNNISAIGTKAQMEERNQMKEKLIRDADELQGGTYDKPLPCFGCGIGWFAFLLGFVFPPMWYYATILYFGSYYRKDLRERLGLAVSAFAALIFSVAALITAVALIILAIQ
ncbi:large ribosomal subunit protein eL20z-like [Magnolia sinica]|uniref:large ribosomal subunit protein eL20z-like n=1 Tax=Magnolia sinica TaxID=86752 RepID=UPI002659957C|nr:large ribosomal subunit protein eL20z-like [Magnolia sinica]